MTGQGVCSYIPILDCSAMGLKILEENVKINDLQDFGEKLKDAFECFGMCYLKNHGVEEHLIEDYMAASRNFFAQPIEEKEKFKREPELYSGWIGKEKEALNQKRPGDLKETYEYCPQGEANAEYWPDPDMKKYGESLFDSSKALGERLCDCLSIGLGLSKHFMSDAHKIVGKKGNLTALRSLYYPPIPLDAIIKPGQVRLGEHTDFGTMTLLFQDDIGGLEVEIPGKGFVPVTPIPGTIVVNIGDMLQRWTADLLVARKHRVLIPEVEMIKRKPRQSVAFFIIPDNDCEIKPLDGSDKYETVSSIDYMTQKIKSALYT